MLTNNAFAVVAQQLPAGFMQWYLVLMVLAVILGTLLDMAHKGSASYFFDNWRKSKGKGTRPIGGGELVSIAAETVLVDVMTSGEFCNPRRRLAHLLTMYGFVIYLVTTAIMVFGDSRSAEIVPLAWWIGGLMVCAGGYWFWFFIRVDVAAEGHSPLRVRASRHLHRLAARERHARPRLGRGGRRGGRALRPVPARHHGALRLGVLVEVRAHVLQAGGGLRETADEGQWHSREPADADP